MPDNQLVETPQVGLDTVREVSNAITTAHVIAYFIPEVKEEAVALGCTSGAQRYFALRAAAMGPVPWQLVLATFYNFAPRAVQTLGNAWDVAAPERWQQARFAAVDRAMRRVEVALSAEQVAEARSLVDPLVADADYAGRPLAAANAAVALPADPLLALWQQITVLREWRGDAHIAVLAAHRLGPCDCNVMQTATGRFPVAIARATRAWNDEEWAAATDRLVTRGWLDADGSATSAGATAREQIELETDELCMPLWSALEDAGTRRLTALITPITGAFAAAGTFAALR